MATDELKHKIQKARFQIKGLPDLDRGVEEQEEEIRELEERIREQMRVLEQLRDIGTKAKTEREENETAMDI